uniref:Uncharacterized protein n=1 Tax=Tanacetum cinerariifolium TaxID=118510 RepID=A0A699HDN7_TANCI|nr:hypothetical protein [Tanacetum cinerariifolium]
MDRLGEFFSHLLCIIKWARLRMPQRICNTEALGLSNAKVFPVGHKLMIVIVDKVDESIRCWWGRKWIVVVDWCDLKSVSECVFGGPSITPLLLPEDISVFSETYSSYQEAGVKIQTALLLTIAVPLLSVAIMSSTPDGYVFTGGSGDEDANGLDTCNWCKRFLEINSLLLSISLGHQLSLVFQNITVLIKFNFVNPLESYNHDTVWLRVIQAPQGISCKLFSGGYQSRWVANDIMERVILALFIEMMKYLRYVDEGILAELSGTYTVGAGETRLSTREGSRRQKNRSDSCTEMHMSHWLSHLIKLNVNGFHKSSGSFVVDSITFPA